VQRFYRGKYGIKRRAERGGWSKEKGAAPRGKDGCAICRESSCRHGEKKYPLRRGRKIAGRTARDTLWFEKRLRTSQQEKLRNKGKKGGERLAEVFGQKLLHQIISVFQI